MSDDSATSQLVQDDILVIDDRPENLDLLMGLLRSRGYGVRVATSGERALGAARAQPPHLILLDVAMPGLDGYAVCERLRAQPATREVPIIFVSAQDDVFDKVRAFRAGGSDYVTKPFQFEEVLVRIEHQLTLRRLQAAMEEKTRELERKNHELTAWQERVLLTNQRAALIFSAFSDALPGTVLDGRYRLEAKIGAGGFGVVFRARHLELDRMVAVKVFQPSAGNATSAGIERFRREGASACRVAHPHAVAIFDSGVTPSGVHYVVMELLEGHTLAEEMQLRGRLSPERCAEILTPVCSVLAAAHAAGIVHRDIKPQNVMLHSAGDREVVKVVDFGLAKLVEDDPTEELLTLSMAGAVGTPHYMAPEVLAQLGCDGRSDVYGVGVLLYRMLSGRLPHHTLERGMLAMLVEHMARRPIPLRESAPHLSEAVERVVMAALAADPARRPAPLELARLFQQALAA